jgi:hypothetical protein
VEKVFLADGRKFLGLLRFVCGDVRDHIVSPKIDQGPLQRRYSPLQRQTRLEINLREIFGVVRFSTFATVSVR